MTDLPPDAVHPLTLADWHRWLEAHHRTSPGVWLVTYRTATGLPRVGYDEAVSEALCWGWIDSVTRVFDDQRTLLRFTPRKPGSVWARSNKDRLVRLEAEGRIEPAGRAVLEAARADGSWTLLDGAEALEVPADLAEALSRLPDARPNFEAFPAGERKQILGWIALAKTPATRARRIDETARNVQQNLRRRLWPRPGKA